MKKRVLTILSLVVCFSLVAVMLPGIPAHAETIDGLNYEFYDDTMWGGNSFYAKVTGPGAGSDIDILTVPDTVTYNGAVYPVEAIGGSGFGECSSLKKIVVGRNIKSMETFTGCSRLQSIVFYGDAPDMVFGDLTEGTNVNVCYPQENPTWTEEVRQSMGDNLIWGHSYQSGACQYCGEAAPEVTGDISGDGKVTVADVSMLYSYIQGTQELTEEQAAAMDLTGDGKVNIADVARIYQSVRGTNPL